MSDRSTSFRGSIFFYRGNPMADLRGLYCLILMLKDFLYVFKGFSLYKIDLYTKSLYLIIMDELVTCEYCGNVWDGNAQCNCYESMIESDEQIMGLVPPSNHNSVETEVEISNKKEKPINETDDIDEIDKESQKSETYIDEIIEL
jgi:hypothetical protein